VVHKGLASEAGLGEAGAGYPVFAEGQRYSSQVLAPGLAGEGRVDEVGDLERTRVASDSAGDPRPATVVTTPTKPGSDLGAQTGVEVVLSAEWFVDGRALVRPQTRGSVCVGSSAS
jgi:hypothetical protein